MIYNISEHANVLFVCFFLFMYSVYCDGMTESQYVLMQEAGYGSTSITHCVTSGDSSLYWGGIVFSHD